MVKFISLLFKLKNYGPVQIVGEQCGRHKFWCVSSLVSLVNILLAIKILCSYNSLKCQKQLRDWEITLDNYFLDRFPV